MNLTIKVASLVGFCWGVKRALDLALNSRSRFKEKKIYSYGPLIHNHETVKWLRKNGIETINPLKPALLSKKKVASTVILIRTHGIPPDIQKQLENYGYEIIDTTCPHVKLTAKRVAQYAQQEHQIIIVGDKKHAEVATLIGYALAYQANKNKYKPLVVSSVEEAQRLSKRLALQLKSSSSNRLFCIVAQSTFQKKEYQEISNIFKKALEHLVILNTICQETTKRQQEVIKLAQEVEAMIVIGAHQSANTKRLFQLACSTGVPTFHIANEQELSLQKISKFRSIGLTTGTSTPDWVIQRVLQKLHSLSRKSL